MELEWSEVCILAQKATIPSKGFLILDITAGKNKSCDGVTNVHLFWASGRI
jgi:hypothetical protein